MISTEPTEQSETFAFARSTNRFEARSSRAFGISEGAVGEGIEMGFGVALDVRVGDAFDDKDRQAGEQGARGYRDNPHSVEFTHERPPDPEWVHLDTGPD